MVDRTSFNGLAVWFAGIVALALVVGGSVGVAVLSGDRSPPRMDDLHVSNHDDRIHRVHVEISSADDSEVVFSETVRVDPDERLSWETATEYDREYRLVATVDDRAPESFDRTGPDDLCTTEVRIESNGTVETGTSCA